MENNKLKVALCETQVVIVVRSKMMTLLLRKSALKSHRFVRLAG